MISLTQILCIDGLPVKQLEHTDVVKMFQTRQKVVLVVLPVLFKIVCPRNHAFSCDILYMAQFALEIL